MISHINGKVKSKNIPTLIIDVSGLGYEVWTTFNTFKKYDLNDEIFLHTHLVIREDNWQLFGFDSINERNVFKELIKVNGIGVKTALAILSGMEQEVFVSSIVNHDSSLLCSIPGIGKKTAERLIIDMKDRINKIFTQDEMCLVDIDTKQNDDLSNINEAILALEALGYSNKDAVKLIKKVSDQAKSTEELIKLALQKKL